MKKTLVVLALVTSLAPAPAGAQAWEAAAAADSAALVRSVRATLAAVPAAPAVAPAAAPAHRPQALTDLLDLVEATARAGRRPVVIFDLDDTLVDTGYRQMTIVREFAAQPDVRARFPAAATAMASLRYEHLHYDLGDTLKALGVDDAAVRNELTAFWAARFFDNRYLLLDQANPGGVDYVRETLRRGGSVVYLTGRWEAMRPGTEGSLAAMGYPAADGVRVTLMMKPDRALPDLDFKNAAFDSVARLGEVVGGFENEPANVNAYRARFRTGIYVFLDTRHSTTAVVPDPAIAWVGDFRR